MICGCRKHPHTTVSASCQHTRYTPQVSTIISAHATSLLQKFAENHAHSCAEHRLHLRCQPRHSRVPCGQRAARGASLSKGAPGAPAYPSCLRSRWPRCKSLISKDVIPPALTGLVSLCPHRKAQGFRTAKYQKCICSLAKVSAVPACPAAAPLGVARHAQPPAARGAGIRARRRFQKFLRG